MARSKTFPLLFLLGFVSLSALPTIANSTADLLVLSLMWPGTYCSGGLFNQCCLPTTGKPALDFFVQGFETYDNKTDQPVTNCNSTECRFSVNALRNLITDLYAYWTDVSCPSNNGRDQWEHAWCTYGTCSNLTQVQYFNQSLLLRARVDLLSTLKGQGIVPSKTEEYNLTDIQDALIPTLGLSTVVECKRNWFSFWEYQLYKIHICVSSDGTSTVSCPVQKSINCGSKVKFYPFSLDMLADDTANPIKMPTARDVDM